MELWDHPIRHLIYFLSGGTVFGIIAHAVNTFPTPSNKYGAWLLGCIQFAVGQRQVARNTLEGLQTKAVGYQTGVSESGETK